jgi:hypothetical protein
MMIFPQLAVGWRRPRLASYGLIRFFDHRKSHQSRDNAVIDLYPVDVQ